MTLKDYAIKAFKEGSDNFNEIITGDVGELTYSPLLRYYSMTVFLLESLDNNPHTSTSGIGFYVVDTDRGFQLEVCSGHVLPWLIPITHEIMDELEKAIIIKY